jgi:two-component system chemotaxis sensor kinase CheA
MMLIDRETIDIYIEETIQSLSEVEKTLLILENMGGNIELSLARRVYHAMHIIRNGANILSLSKIKELSQKIENVLGLICTERLTPNPEVINILLQGIDRMQQLIDLIHSNEDIDIDEHSVLLTGLTSAVLPEEIKHSVTEIRDIPIPDGKYVFHIPEFNLIQEIEQGKNIYILIYDLIKDVQEKNNTPLNFVRFIQQHGEVIDSVFDFKSIGTLEEQTFGSEMPYFVLLASTLKYEQLVESLGVKSHQIKQIKNAIADLTHPKTEPDHQNLTSAIPVHHRKTGQKDRLELLNALSCELNFAMDCFSNYSNNTLSITKARMQSVQKRFQEFLNHENSILVSNVLWKIGRNIRDFAYQSNIQAKLELQCGQIMMDRRVLSRLIEPLTAIVMKMIRLVQSETPVQICLNMTKNAGSIEMVISFFDPQIVTKKAYLDYPDEEKKINALCATIKQSFEAQTGLSVTIRFPLHLRIIPGYCISIDQQFYIIPRFNVKDCLINLNPSMWRCENDTTITLHDNERCIPVIGISNSDFLQLKNKTTLIVCEVGKHCFGLAADSPKIVEVDAICQPLSKQLSSNPSIFANCLLDKGQIAFVPDMGFLANKLF